MSVFNLYAYRRRASQGELPDVWEYEYLSEQLRVQIIYILRDALGSKDGRSGWKQIHNIVAREHGVFALASGRTPQLQCERFLREYSGVDEVIDFVETAFDFIQSVVKQLRHYRKEELGIQLEADDAIVELNERFRRAGAGYQFEGGRIIRIDSDLIHSQIVRPTLQFLQQPGFEGPRNEFLKAHAHYRSGEMKDAIVNANNSFESVLKAICDERRWQYHKGARASDLLKLVRDKGLFPTYLQKSFEQLAATLKSGLPKVRGEEGAHGQGAREQETPRHVAAYALHLAAATILFLAQAHEQKK